VAPGTGFLLVATATVALATAVTGGRGATADRVLRVVSPVPVNSLDPGLAASETALEVASETCTTLVRFRGATLVPDGAVALPTVSTGGRRYVFTIRRDLRFSDGTAVTAASYATAIGRVRNAAFGSVWNLLAGVSDDIVSAHGSGRILVVRLSAADGSLLARLAEPWACPVPVGSPADPRGLQTVPSSGPYTISSAAADQRTILVRNPAYRGFRLRRPAEIDLTTGGTYRTDAAAIDSGQFDLLEAFAAVSGPPETVLQDWASRYGINRGSFLAAPSTNVVYLALNNDSALFHGNPRLRRAVALALDRAQIIGQGGFLAAAPTGRLVPPRLPGAARLPAYPQGNRDVAAARKLAAGSLRDGVAVLWAADDPLAVRRADAIQEELAQIGLRVQMQTFPRPLLTQKIATRGAGFDLALTGWVSLYYDPADFLVRLLDGSSLALTNNFNVAYFDDPRVNAALASAQRLPVPQRYRALGRLETTILRDDAPVVPLFNQYNFLFLSPRVGCYAARNGAALGAGLPDWGSFCVS
jgi:peptide/nickel transport system substrate-binding protein